MTNHSHPNNKEHASTYFVQDRSNKEELQRLQIQDHLLTTAMGGVLPEQPDTFHFERVLDIGCGPGGWLIETAQAYSDCTSLIGVDISTRIVEYARSQAQAAQVQERVEFLVMDALRMLEFPNDFFHLINVRCSSSFVRTWEWPKLLEEMGRVCRPGGLLRMTEPEIVTHSSNRTLPLFGMQIQEALFRAGYLFDNIPAGTTVHLPRLLTQYGGRRLQAQGRLHTLTFRAGTPEGEAFLEDVTRAVHVLKPFVLKWYSPPIEYDTLAQQVLEEIHQPEFFATWNLLTVWATK